MAQRQRLFFALRPDAALREAIATSPAMALAAAAGTPVPAQRLHLTLAFLGDVPVHQVGEVIAAAGRCRGQSFELTLDTLGYWPGPHVCWLGCDATPPALDDLVTALWAELADAGCTRPAHEFVPHVTLARAVTAVPDLARADLAPLRWPVPGFSLLRSQHNSAGLHYELLASWTLFTVAR